MVLACWPGVALAQASLDSLSVYPLPDGGEILSYDPVTRTLAVTAERGVRLLELDSVGGLSQRRFVDLDRALGEPEELRSISSVALDPAGRGFGAVSLIPRDNGTKRGSVVLFSLANGSVGRTIGAGYHPDAVVFAPDGRRLFVVNEGEFTVGGISDAPGSLSVIDLSGVTGADDLNQARFAGDFPLTRWSVSRRVDLSVLRMNDETDQPYRHAEPEYAAALDGRVYVSLQENNAVGVFSVQDRQWLSVWPMGVVPLTIDASDRDGVAAFEQQVEGLPMPDTIAVYRAGDRRVLVSADEGDFRPDDGDRKRAGDFAGVAPGSGLDAEAVADPARLGRLRVSVPDSDPDGDGLLDRLVIPGARGVSFWDADTGHRLGGTGSLEPWLFGQDPERHNLNAKEAAEGPDQRSDDKGPEPEAVAVTTLPDGGVWVAAAMERQNGLVLIDATDPSAPEPVGYRNDLDAGLLAPECVVWIDPEDGGSQRWLVVGYEGDGTGVGCGVAVYRLVLP